MGELKPFHESVIDAIEKAGRTEDANEHTARLYLLAELICNTKIPENAGQILAAWKRVALHDDLKGAPYFCPARFIEAHTTLLEQAEKQQNIAV